MPNISQALKHYLQMAFDSNKIKKPETKVFDFYAYLSEASGKLAKSRTKQEKYLKIMGVFFFSLAFIVFTSYFLLTRFPYLFPIWTYYVYLGLGILSALAMGVYEVFFVIEEIKQWKIKKF